MKEIYKKFLPAGAAIVVIFICLVTVLTSWTKIGELESSLDIEKEKESYCINNFTDLMDLSARLESSYNNLNTAMLDYESLFINYCTIYNMDSFKKKQGEIVDTLKGIYNEYNSIQDTFGEMTEDFHKMFNQ